MFDVAILVLAIVLFSVLAFRGVSAVILGPLVSLLLVIFARLPGVETMLGPYMASASGYFKDYFFVFFVGAIFGAIYEETKAAKSVALMLSKITRGKFTAPLIILITGVLTYGGISGFVVYFVVYPIALQLFRENNISRKILPAAISAGCWTFTMNGPGSPAIQNIIPMRALGTSSTAALVPGAIGSLFQLVVIFIWLEYRSRSLNKQGRYFIDDRLTPLPVDEMESEMAMSEDIPNSYLALVPIILILVCFNGFKMAVELAVLIGIVVSLVLFYRYIPDKKAGLIKLFNKGGGNSISAICNTALVVGFGGVVAQTVGFEKVIAGLQGINISPLWFVAITVSVAAGVCGSASGGMGVAFDALGSTYANMGVSLEYVHRISAIASGTLDTLPHQGAQITLLTLCHLNHKEAYLDIFITQVVVPVITLFVVIPLMNMGL
jgi:H+/gluconate symporter-like permease